MNKYIKSTIVAAVALLATVSAYAKPDVSDFRSDMRKLWEDHVTWTRLYIVSAVADLPDKDATARRLLQNQTDIGDAVKGFYGDAAGVKLTSLLKEHIVIATEIIDAAKAGDAAKKDDASKRWVVNADEIVRPLVPNFIKAFKTNQWAAINATLPPVYVLKAPVKGPNGALITWNYASASPTNNPGRFDLWADFPDGTNTVRISNWNRQPIIVN